MNVRRGHNAGRGRLWVVERLIGELVGGRWTWAHAYLESVVRPVSTCQWRVDSGTVQNTTHRSIMH